MNYATLQQFILDDTHKSQYVGTPIQEMIAQGEALIGAHLEAFNFLSQLTDTNRVSAGSSTYNLPAGLSQLRYVRINGLPLDKVDETSAYLAKDNNASTQYAQRVGQIIIAGNPGVGVNIDLDYMGMPDPLATTATNTLLTNYARLYVDATSFYVFRRAQDYESGQAALESFLALVSQINRKTKKMLGGAQAVGPYNVSFRSSY